jgi:hypothetical protein
MRLVRSFRAVRCREAVQTTRQDAQLRGLRWL